MIKPAIVVVTYNRPDSLSRLLSSIKKAYFSVKDVTLIISIDKSKDEDNILNISNSFEWNYGKKIIRTFERNQGLRQHVLQCGDLSNKYGAVIILEDDLVVSESFYEYAYQSVNNYKELKNLAGISLYSHAWNGYANVSFNPVKSKYDVFFGQFSVSWGQCWLKDRWNDFRHWYSLHEDKLPLKNEMMPSSISRWNSHSWGKYYASYIVEKNLFYVIPYSSMSTNFSESGQHRRSTSNAYQTILLEGVKERYNFPSFDESIKYDIFFERVFNGKVLKDISGDEICWNLNGSKSNTLDKKYLLTQEDLKLELIHSYGIEMRPIDENVIFGVPGKEIKLYRLVEPIALNFKPYCAKRDVYETFDIHWKVLFKLFIKKFSASIKARIK